ncbi:MAG TPA: COX15/CtaA family protein [Longimicrobium sp.]|nr:COX15/CtaA family protein [Longimicrobium sp.]
MTGPAALTRFARYAWAVLAANVGVVLWGAYVRATGSGAGCGDHWPKCDGEVIPRLASTEQVIEFTHRATSGIALLMVVALLVWSRRATPRGHAARAGAAWSMFFMLTEAAVGAGLVLLKLVAGNQSLARVWWMAAHLVNTFLLLGALALTAWWASGGRRFRLRGGGALGGVLAFAVLATLLVGVTGAVTALGDTLFPKTSVGLDLAPTAHFLERLRVVHPVVAVLTGLLVVAAGALARRRRPSRATVVLSHALTALFATQVIAGTVNVLLLAPVWMQIVHLLLADAVWIALVLTAASALAVEEPAVTTETEAREPDLVLSA